MSYALQSFAFDSHAVRVVTRDGEPWFIASDLAHVLAYRNAPDMVRMLDEDEKGTQIVRTPGGEQTMLVVNESGLYAAILKSRKPEAKKFKKWVTAEVLPAIRKTGGYALPGAQPHNPADAAASQMLQALTKLLERSEAREERFMNMVERLLPQAGRPARRKAKTMYAPDREQILAMRRGGAALDAIVAATGFSQTQVSYVLNGLVRTRADGRVVTSHLAKEVAQGPDLFGLGGVAA